MTGEARHKHTPPLLFEMIPFARHEVYDDLASETDWIRQALQGDAAGWEAIVQANQQPVFHLAYLLLGDADEAEDAAQETFIRAYRALDQFEAGRPIRPWLMRITTRTAYNRQRSAGRYLAAIKKLFRNETLPISSQQQVEQNLETRESLECDPAVEPA